MADAYKKTEERITEVCTSVGGQKKPNISQLARYFYVPASRLRAWLQDRQSRSARVKATKRLTEGQELAVIPWIRKIDSIMISPTASMITDYVNKWYIVNNRSLALNGGCS